MMSRFVITEQINTPNALKEFDMNGYRYSSEQSSDTKLVFLRDAAEE